MKTNTRMIRINDEIKKEVSTILRGELKDPRVGVITSVLKVDTTNDLKYCKIFVSILGDDEKKEEVMQVLNRASGFVRSLIAKRILELLLKLSLYLMIRWNIALRLIRLLEKLTISRGFVCMRIQLSRI